MTEGLTHEELDGLPHGAVVYTSSREPLTMNREDFTQPVFIDTDGGATYPHNVVVVFGSVTLG